MSEIDQISIDQDQTLKTSKRKTTLNRFQHKKHRKTNPCDKQTETLSNGVVTEPLKRFKPRKYSSELVRKTSNKTTYKPKIRKSRNTR